MERQKLLMPSRIPRNCEHCGNQFLAVAGEVNHGRGRFCSRSCGSSKRRICTTDGCGQKHVAKGFCATCYAKANSEHIRSLERARRVANLEEARRKSAKKQRDRRAKSPDAVREYSRNLRAADPEKFREQARQRRDRNLTSILRREKLWREANKEHVLTRAQAYRDANPERYRGYTSQRRVRVSVNMSAADRQDSAEWRMAIKDDPCFYCGEHADIMHDDHMTPLVRGGTDHWSNLVRSCARCNQTKHTRTAEEFLEWKAVPSEAKGN